MRIKGIDVDIDTLMNDLNIDHDFYLKRKNGLSLKDSQIDILTRYQINYKNYSSLSSLIFEIEETLQQYTDAEDLEHVAQELSEYHYYNETHK